MATVRFSERLIEDIERNARKSFDAQEAAARSAVPKDMGDRIYDKMFDGATQAKMNALPEGYLKEIDQAPFRGFVGMPENVDANLYRLDSSVDIYFSSKRRWPSGNKFPEIATGVEYDSFYGIKLNWHDERWDELKAEIYNYKIGIQRVNEKKAAFVEGVKKVIRAFSTLAPALKEWPALWDLLPDEAKERHKKIVDRKKTTAGDLDTDLDALTAQVTYNKLTR